MSDHQVRGHCQICGRIQAVLSIGHMAKHGYSLEHGFFQGACHGDMHKPMQRSREQTDLVVLAMRNAADQAQHDRDRVEAGELRPKTIQRGHGHQKVEVPWSEAHSWEQYDAIKVLKYQLERRARGLCMDATVLESLVNQVHGQELRIVPKPKPSKPIQAGESRLRNGKVLVARRVEGPRVYYSASQGGPARFFPWMGSGAWRQLPLRGGEES